MNADLILFECRRRDVKLDVAGDQIRVVGSRANLSGEFLALIRDRKPDLIAILDGSTRSDLAHSEGDLAHSVAHSGGESALGKCAKSTPDSACSSEVEDAPTPEREKLAHLAHSKKGVSTPLRKDNQHTSFVGDSQGSRGVNIDSPIQKGAHSTESALSAPSALEPSSALERARLGLPIIFDGIVVDVPNLDRMREAIAALPGHRRFAIEQE